VQHSQSPILAAGGAVIRQLMSYVGYPTLFSEMSKNVSVLVPSALRFAFYEKAAAGLRQRRLYSYSRGTLLRATRRLLVIFMRGKLRNASHCCSIRFCLGSLVAMLGAQRKP
jgi:hypothetical protein